MGRAVITAQKPGPFSKSWNYGGDTAIVGDIKGNKKEVRIPRFLPCSCLQCLTSAFFGHTTWKLKSKRAYIFYTNHRRNEVRNGSESKQEIYRK